ncbi:MAG: hypothetical protein CMF96_10625 [Candidatus Marinimicrobia bacterium]|nr:hypothetical protein [Candidatus Neomarinimicrobiota bacterium]
MDIYNYANKIVYYFKPLIKHETSLENWQQNIIKQCIGIDEQGLQSYICGWEYSDKNYYKIIPCFYSKYIKIKAKNNEMIIKYTLQKILLKKTNKDITLYILNYL